MSELGMIYWSRRITLWAFVAALAWLAYAVVSAILGTGLLQGIRQLLVGVGAEALVRAAWPVLGWIGPPVLALVAVAVVARIRRSRDVRRRDPLRKFNREQRREGLARAGGQCELEVARRRRCPNPATTGDHFFPWKKGGSTVMTNFVAACASCDRSKGTSIPSPKSRQRLEERRHSYFPASVRVQAGERNEISGRTQTAAWLMG
ncbi:HNH endonuclease signature motif containing protein [Arthrobacter sp. NPDC089319]|uniref:HNH endonuclease n=1 Tax=Arthrobacter sp. NPDC089319 TaxID=3155915 RepID=UPI003444405C